MQSFSIRLSGAVVGKRDLKKGGHFYDVLMKEPRAQVVSIYSKRNLAEGEEFNGVVKVDASKEYGLSVFDQERA